MGGALDVLMMGCGVSGREVVGWVHSLGLGGVRCVALDLDAGGLEGCQVPEKVLLGEGVLCGVKAPWDPGAVEQAVFSSRVSVLRVLENAKRTVLVAGIRDEAEAAQAAAIAEVVDDGMRDLCVLAVVGILDDGPMKTRLVEGVLRDLRSNSRGVEIFDLGGIPKDPGLTLRALNDQVKASLEQAVERALALADGTRS